MDDMDDMDDMTYPDIVVASGCSETALAMGFKVGRIYRRVVVMPGHKQRSCLHIGSATGTRPGNELVVTVMRGGCGCGCVVCCVVLCVALEWNEECQWLVEE